MDDVGAYFFKFGDDPAIPVDFAQLPAELIKNATEYATELVYVKAAPRIDYGRVVTLIETMGKSGYNKVALDKNENAAALDAPAADAAAAAPAG